MTTEAIELADMIDRSEETTGFERRMASVMRSQAAEIDRLRAEAKTCGSGAGCCAQAAEIERLTAELGDLPEAQADMLSACKRKDALIRRAWSVIRWQCFGECRTPGVAGLPTAAEVDDEIKTELGE